MHRAATPTLATLATLLAALSLASPAQARDEYVPRFPNGGINTCNNCHPGGNTLALNIFGQDSLALINDPPADWWPALDELDSDGDGQTNRQELGDPCSVWVIGATPGRTTDISNPGLANSVSADPDSPSCDATTSSAATTGATTGAATTGGATVGAGAGGGAGGGGEGGTPQPSTGAGKADPGVNLTPGACSVSASPGAPLSNHLGGVAAFFAALALFSTRSLTRSLGRSRSATRPRPGQ